MKDRISDIKFYYDLENCDSFKDLPRRPLALFSCTIDNTFKIGHMFLCRDGQNFEIIYPAVTYTDKEKSIPFFEILDPDCQVSFVKEVVDAYKDIMDNE